jgi:hypothetical protein
MTMNTGCVLICDVCGLELSGRRNTIYRVAAEAGWVCTETEDRCINCVAAQEVENANRD